jgi:hypothetical protein
MIAMTESFVADMLDALTSKYTTLVPEFVSISWAKNQSVLAEAGWRQLRDAWADWHRVPLGSAPAWDSLLSFVEVRNSVMHGQGFLTRKQLGSDFGKSIHGSLRKIDVTVDSSGGLNLTERHVANCATSCASLIAWLDERVTQTSSV